MKKMLYFLTDVEVTAMVATFKCRENHEKILFKDAVEHRAEG